MPFSAAEGGGEKEKKKVGNPIGDPVRGRDAPITLHLKMLTYTPCTVYFFVTHEDHSVLLIAVLLSSVKSCTELILLLFALPKYMQAIRYMYTVQVI